MLLYQLEDRRVQSFFLGGKQPRREPVEAVYRHLRDGAAADGRAHSIGMRALAQHLGMSTRELATLIAPLDDAGIVRKSLRGVRFLRPFRSGDGQNEEEEFFAQLGERHEGDRRRLDAMMGYAQTALCRVRYLKNYFAEPVGHDCGHCDNCRSGLAAEARPQRRPRRRHSATSAAARPELALPFQVGEQVRHRFFGDGEVTAVEGSRVTVRFPRAGMKKVHPSFLHKAPPGPGASQSAA